MVNAGWKLVDIERKLNRLLTARQISAQKQKWKRDEFKTDSRYARFHTPKYVAWKKAVLKKDNYRCVVCKRRKPQVKVLQCDHIIAWSQNVELRYDVSNGQVLCIRCHKRTPTYGFKARTYKSTIEKNRDWIKTEQDLWQMQQIKRNLKKHLK